MKFWIQNNLFTSTGTINSKKCRFQWFEKYENDDKFNKIIELTSFLDKNATIPQRCWHIINDVYEIIKCGGINCSNSKQFFSFNRGYVRNCSVSCGQSNLITYNKKQKNSIKKYGVSHPLKSKLVKNKINKTMLDKYGIENISQLEDIKKRRSIRMSDKQYQRKLVSGMIKKYGVDNIAKDEKTAYNRKITRRINHYQEYFLPYLKQNDIDFLDSEELYTKLGVGRDIKYNFLCKKCNIKFLDYCYSHVPRCEKCYPKYVSKAQSEIYNFIVDVIDDKVLLNDRTILGNREIDIYIPSKKIAIEYNGLYWHSESNGVDRNYHLNKTTECNNKGIQLLHIFENEWIYKKDIVKSIIRSKLKLNKYKIFARKCEIKEVSFTDSKEFLNKNHLQGDTISNNKIGLYYRDKLVSLMTFGKNRFSNDGVELIRFANKLNTIVVGGASRLFNFYIKNNNVKSVTSFADRRFSNGGLYSKLGFDYIYNSGVNYYYFNLKKSYKLYNRLKFQKHKLPDVLENFNKNLTEVENMKMNGYDRIFDCGHLKYKWIYNNN